MARTIMDHIHENITPTMVSNAIVETMLDWRETEMLIGISTPKSRTWRTLRTKRDTLEKVLSHFMGVNQSEMRRVLNEHFFTGKEVDR